MGTKSVQTFMDSPLSYFGESITPMHSIPRGELEELQREAMILRFGEHREKIEMVRRLADRLDVTAVDKFDDIVPLMFSHTAYKSYPAALIDNNRWDLMTRWLDKLTTYDLSGVDVEACDSIDEWLDRLETQTPLQIVTSSGTTGTFSVIPKDVPITVEGMHIWKMMVFQAFGKEPTDDELNPVVDVIWPNFSEGRFGMTRMVPWMKREFTGADESRFHALYSGAMDTDLMFLANKMRAAAARGELDRLQLDPKLAARKDEFIAMQQRQMTEVPEFIARLTNELRGKRVFMTSTYNLMYNLASAGLEEGVRAEFASNSAILTGGGAKGQVLPEGYMDVIKEFYGGVRMSGTDRQGLDNANRLGELMYESLMRLPEALSTKPKVVNRTLLEHVEGSRLTEDWYRVFGGQDGEGAIIVSQIDEPVHYSAMLSGRVANVVPVDTIEKVTDAVNAFTQTIGIYPESLKHELRDRLPLFGAQRLTSLGYAASVNFVIPQDAMEPVRRMCKWIVDEECEPDRVFPLWETPDLAFSDG